MSKVRVHEYAKKVNKTSKEVIEQLSKFDVTVTNHMSMLEPGAVSKLDAVFKQVAEPKKTAPSKSPAAAGQQQAKSTSGPAPKTGQQVKKQEARPQQSANSNQQ